MVKIYLIIVYFLLCCTQSKETNKDLYKEEILGESFYANGRSKIKVIKGRTPGEDTYLNILHFDSIGKLSLEYGAQHYGSKYKSAYKYDKQGKLIEELVYSFDSLKGQFENYIETYHDYTINDTLANFDGYISSKILHNYSKGMDIQSTFELISNSFNKNNYFSLTHIDTFRDKSNDNFRK